MLGRAGRGGCRVVSKLGGATSPSDPAVPISSGRRIDRKRDRMMAACGYGRETHGWEKARAQENY